MSELYGFRTRSGYRNQPPLGIACIAGVLRHQGFPVTLVDAAAEGWDLQATVDRVLAWHPDVIGVTAITLETPAAYALLRALRGGRRRRWCWAGPTRTRATSRAVGMPGRGRRRCRRRRADDAGAVSRAGGREDAGEDPRASGPARRRVVLGVPRAAALQDLDALPLPAYDLLRWPGTSRCPTGASGCRPPA